MSLRALFFLIGYVGLLLATFRYVQVGPWAYLFEWYNHPVYFWWGKEVPNIVGGRWSFAIGAVMVFSVFMHLNKIKHIPVIAHMETKLMIAYVTNAYIVSLWAYSGQESWDMAMEHLKVFVVFYCVVKTQSDRRYLDILLLVGIAGCVSWGYEVATGNYSSRQVGVGAPGTYGVNTASAHVVSMLPFMAWFALTRKGWIRWLCLLGIPMIIQFVSIGRSRGAMLALGAMMFVTVLFTRGRMRGWAIVGSIAGAGLVLFLMDPAFLNRMLGLSNYESDGSATGRIEAWTAAWELVKRNPFGYGGESFDTGLGAALMPGTFHTTHNMYLEVLVAWGVQGFIFIFGFIFLTIRECKRIYLNSWDRKSWPPPYEAVVSISVMTSLISMLVASIFLNRYRWEYWWIHAATILCLKNILAQEAAEKLISATAIARTKKIK